MTKILRSYILQSLKEALHAAHAALELLRKLHDAVNGIDERCDIQKVRHKLRGVDGAVHHEDSARNDDHDIHETFVRFSYEDKANVNWTAKEAFPHF